MNLWLETNFFYNSKHEMKLRVPLNIQIKNEFHLGVDFKTDFKKAKKADLQLAWARENGTGFFKGDLLKQAWTIGCSHHTHSGNKHWHGLELTYTTGEKAKKDGINGLPLYVKWVGQYQMTYNIEWKSKIDLKKEWTISNSWNQKFND